MIRVFGKDSRKIGAFDDYGVLLRFIEGIENRKRVENSPAYGQDYWSFKHYAPEQLKRACFGIKPEYVSRARTKALEEGCGLLEIDRGVYGSKQEIVMDRQVDVAQMRQAFCLEYCAHQGWLVFETRWPLPPCRISARKRDNETIRKGQAILAGEQSAHCEESETSKELNRALRVLPVRSALIRAWKEKVPGKGDRG